MRNPFSFPWLSKQLESDGAEQTPGLILAQIDGLSRSSFKAALADGAMPFLQSLLSGPAFQLHAMEPVRCCCAICPLAVESSANDWGRSPLVRVKYDVGGASRRCCRWLRRAKNFDQLARIDHALARIARRAARGTRRYQLWVHARQAFAMVPVDAPLPRCCADEGVPLKPADLRATFERYREYPLAPPAPRQRVMGNGGKRVLRVLSYDVHHCLGLDGRWSPARIAEVIAHSGAEVICLQNLDVDDRCGEANQAEQIRALLQARRRSAMQTHERRSWQVKFDRHGNAVLSRFAMRLVKTGIATAANARPLCRSMLWVQVDVDGNTPVQFLSSHPLSRRPRQRSGRAGMSTVDGWIAAASRRGTTILCGDGISDEQSQASRAIASQLVDTTSHPLSRINHLFSTDELSLHSARIIATPLAKLASDHLPVQVGFAMT